MAPPDQPRLDDGTYDALVVDAGRAGDGACQVELTILSGDHKGEVVAVRTRSLSTDQAADLLGIPATLTVTDGAPHVTFEPCPPTSPTTSPAAGP
jgi:hypothetical protein